MTDFTNVKQKTEKDMALIVLSSFKEQGEKIDKHINEFNDGVFKKTNIIKIDEVRFGNGEGKIKIQESVRNKDVYIFCDIGNYSIKYKMYNFENCSSPDDHLQNVKRTISAISGKAKRITLVMPLLYSSRQHRKKGRESLDCATSLQELFAMNISNIITFDAHDPNIVNAIPLGGFDNILPTYVILKEFIAIEKLNIRKDNMIIISPDTGAMTRAISYANMLELDVGMFYKRRDYSVVINGMNPIIEHTYVGQDVKNKTCVIIDDMIASGTSVCDVAYELKNRGAKDVIVISSFAFFTSGLQNFNKLYEQGIIKSIYSTNLSYLNPALKQAPWFKEIDATKFLALIIDTLNKNSSISHLIDSQDKIKELLHNTLKN